MPTIAVLVSSGGLSDCGQHVLAHAVKLEGMRVRAIARAREDIGRVEGRPMADAETMLAMLDRIAIVDFARDQAGLEDVFDGVDAVVACFCSRQHWMDRVGGSAMTTTVAAMEAKGVRRLIFLSSMGIAEDWPPMPWSFFGKVFACMLSTTLRSAYNDLARAERRLRSSHLDYLIVRPMGLNPSEVPVGSWVLLESGRDNARGTLALQIAKADVGAFLLTEALTPTMHRQAIVVGQKQQTNGA